MPLDVHELVADLDHVNHLRRFELILHRLELTPARRAHAVGRVQLVEAIYLWQLGLLGCSELRARLLRVVGLVGWGIFGSSRLGTLYLLRQLLHEGERLLELFRVALQCFELPALLREYFQQLLDLHLLSERYAAQLIDVLLAS